MKVIVTGVNGFVGAHLTRELVIQGDEVIGVGFQKNPSSSVSPYLTKYYSRDLVDTWDIHDEIKAIYHLAGLSSVGPSFDNPQKYIYENSAMLTNMAEYYLHNDKVNSSPKILLVSSGGVYSSEKFFPINELSPVKFTSPYVVSKILVENQAHYYSSRGLDFIIARPFNHIGPGQGQGFLVPDLFQKISESPKSGIIRVGNLSTRRDYTDVRDVVRAYIMLIQSEKVLGGIFNICSGKSYSGIEIFEILKVAMNREDVSYQIDEKLLRPTDNMEVKGSRQKIKNTINWEPKIQINYSIIDFVTANT